MPKPKTPSSELSTPFLPSKKLAQDNVTYETKSPSGASIALMTQAEVDYYDDISERYQKNNKFTNVSDLLELDRVLVHELMCFRWGTWLLAGGVDYDGNPQVSLEKNVQLYSKEIRDLKASLGIDKKSRDANKGANTADFIANLTLRAKEFGVHRNEQVIKAHTLWKELQGLVTLHINSTKSERSEFNAHEADIIAWCQEKFKEFDQIDEVFRQEQRIWIRELND